MILNILLAIFLFFSISQKDIVYEKEYLIASNISPVYIYWISETEILVSDTSRSFIFDLESREKEYIEQCENCITGYDNEVLFCEYVHKDIQSKEDFSTKILIKDRSLNIKKEFDVFPTVIPVVCKNDYVILKNAYSFLEQKVYIFKEDTLKEVYLEKRDLSLKGIPQYRNISIKNQFVIILDMYNQLWIYTN